MDTSKPLPPAALHILIALAEHDHHGYAILQAVRERTAGGIRLGTASLYRHLARLLDADFVAEIAPRSDTDPRRGTHYHLTARGRRALEVEKRRLVDLVNAMDGLRPASRKGQA